MKIHPNDRTLERLLEALVGRDERAVLRHLVDCDGCRERVRLLLAEEEPGARVLPWPAQGYREILERVVERANAAGVPLSREQAEAPILLAELLLVAAEERERRAAEDPRYRSWTLAELLLDRSREVSFEDPGRGAGLARLGLAVVGALDPAAVDPALIEDLRARGLAFLANAQRMSSDLEAAEGTMRAAERSLARGTGDPVERARLLDLQASLAKDLRQFRRAARLLDRAIAHYRDAAEAHRAGRARIKQAGVYRAWGYPKRAIRVLREAVDSLTPEREPRLLLCARHNLAEYLTVLGRTLEARAVFGQAQPLYARFPDAWTQRRRLWLEGKILRGLGQLEAAEARLAEARRGFLEQEIEYDAALVSLDLAAVYAQQGRAGEQRRLAEEMRPLLTARDVHREAQAALSCFRRAAETESASPRLVEGLLEFLAQARHDPGLRFVEPVE